MKYWDKTQRALNECYYDLMKVSRYLDEVNEPDLKEVAEFLFEQYVIKMRERGITWSVD